jgi:hypothetical protein
LRNGSQFVVASDQQNLVRILEFQQTQ